MNPVTINHAGGDINIGTQNNDLNGNSSPALSFFKTSEYESYKNINPKREPQTCRWFLEHPTFQAWKARDKGGLLWLTADPGCGKSVLSRALIDERLVGVGTSKICFFFFKDNNDQSSIATTLCALLHQLLRARKSEGLFSKYCVPAIGECADDLKTDFEELWKVFKKIALDPSVGDIIIVLDALDECPTTSRNILIDRIGELYDDAQEECRLKFLVTSRPYHEIKVKFNPLLRKLFTIRLDGDAESDSICQEIDTVIRTKVANIAQNLDLGNDLAMTLLRKLRETQNRTYLWVHLILEGFEESFAFTHQKIEKFISTLPGSVEAAYERILDRCRNRADARKILHIVIAAQRPLTLEEFDIALEINTDLEAPTTDIRHLNCLGNDHRLAMIRNTCGLFVTVTYNRVSLIHQTAYEFLIQKEASPSTPMTWQYSVYPQDAHQVLAEICIIYHIAYIRSKQHCLISGSCEYFQFIEYTRINWLKHVCLAKMQSLGWILRITELLNLGFNQKVLSTITFREAGLLRAPWEISWDKKRCPLYWTCALGLMDAMKTLLDCRSANLWEMSNASDILQLAVTDRNQGLESTNLLLNSTDPKIPLTQDVLDAVITNFELGAAILQVILESRPNEVITDAELLKKLLSKFRFGKAMPELLSSFLHPCSGRWYTERYCLSTGLLQQIPITDRVVTKAMHLSCSKKTSNDSSCEAKSFVDALLQQRGKDVTISSETIIASLQFSCVHVFTSLVSWRPQDFGLVNMSWEVNGDQTRFKSVCYLVACMLKWPSGDGAISPKKPTGCGDDVAASDQLIQFLVQREKDEGSLESTTRLLSICTRAGKNGARCIRQLLESQEERVLAGVSLLVEDPSSRVERVGAFHFRVTFLPHFHKEYYSHKTKVGMTSRRGL